jgi:hypothetical protein
MIGFTSSFSPFIFFFFLLFYYNPSRSAGLLVSAVEDRDGCQDLGNVGKSDLLLEIC